MSRRLPLAVLLSLAGVVGILVVLNAFQASPTPEALERLWRLRLVNLAGVTRIYVSDYGKLPTEGLQVKLAGELKLLVCPACECAAKPKKLPHYELWYNRGFREGDVIAGSKPFVWDLPGNHKAGRNVVFLDGRYLFLSEPEFEKLMR